MEVKSHRDLFVWQKSMRLITEVYECLRGFPPEEKYGLADQMRRSSISIPSNIAEGRARGTKKDYCRFLQIARGSTAELDTQLEIAYKLNYLKEPQFLKLQLLLNEVSKMLRAMITNIN